MPPPSPSNPAPASCTEGTRLHGPAHRRRGVTLVELIIAMMIISVSVTGMLLLFNRTVRSTGEAVVRKQALAIAESMLNEVLAQPFTYCDPQDPANDTTPASTAACTGGVGGSQDNLAPTPNTESRFSLTDPLDNVADYSGYTMTNDIYSIDGGGAPIPALTGYSATVTIAQDTGAASQFGLPAGEVLRITVRVTFRNGVDVSMTGYRFRYAPNATG